MRVLTKDIWVVMELMIGYEYIGSSSEDRITDFGLALDFTHGARRGWKT